MASKIPTDEAFEAYFALGSNRSYQAIAEKYGVSKRSVTNVAVRDRWQARIAERETKARQATDQKAVETLESMNDRHLKSLKVIQGKALEALRTMSLESAMEAVKALDLAIKQERVVRGQPADRTAVAIEDLIRSEHEKWVATSEPDYGETTDDHEAQGTEQTGLLPIS